MSDPKQIITTKMAGPDEGLLVIHVALFRMATRSMTEAYRILGYKVHHGLDDVWNNPWDLLEQAAEATWPSVPGARPRPRFERKDWDKLWGSEYDIATDLSSSFSDQLIEAYPNAKVVIVQRDFESWYPSYKTQLLDAVFLPANQVIVFLCAKVLGIRAGVAMEKAHLGFFGANTPSEIDGRARSAYDRYYEKIRAMVPPERRLEYKMGDGWEPLCEYLGREVPNVPFPRLNDRKDHQKGIGEKRRAVLMAVVKKVTWWTLFAAVPAAAYLVVRRMNSEGLDIGSSS